MKYLIFSDTHLTQRFDERKFKFLVKISEKADRVIINGDFWDGYLTTFSGFVNSEWKILFPRLLAKKAIYIYGNHDSPDLSDNRVSLFSVEQHFQILVKSGNLNLRIEHGQEIFRMPDKSFPKLVQKIGTAAHNLLRYYHYRIDKNGYLEYYRRPNRHFKMISRSLKKEVLVVGHSHGGEYSEEENFANSGFIDWGYGSYLTVENDKITFHAEEY